MPTNLDYRKFKTPFYQIRVKNPSTGKFKLLPPVIHRLIERVEIVETFAGNKFDTLNIHFIEGSREPHPHDKPLGSGIYPTNSLVTPITNKTGFLSDLTFNGSSTVLASANNTSNTRTTRFLFQEGNQVSITWGYLEDPNSVKSKILPILYWTTEYPENGPVKTVLTCHDVGAQLDQVAMPNGNGFNTTSPTGYTGVHNYQDIPTPQMLEQIAQKGGYALLYSKNLVFLYLEQDHYKTWPAGSSLKQFLSDVAKMSNAYHKVITDPRTNVDTIIFTSKADFESDLIDTTPGYFTYKSPGSIIKNVKISADFAGVGGAAEYGIDKTGNVVSKISDSAEEGSVTFNISAPDNQQLNINTREGLANLKPQSSSTTTKNIINAYNTDPNKKTAGVWNSTPYKDQSSITGTSQSKADSLARIIQIDITTLGYTRFIPGVLHIDGLGNRYSGKYRFMTVTHTIDNTGYTCHAQGNTFALAQGGTRIPAAVEGDNSPEKTETINLTQPVTTSQNTNTGVILRQEITALYTSQLNPALIES